MQLRIWRQLKTENVLLDSTPTGEEEYENLFKNTVENPSDLNEVVLKERLQDMGERIFFADRAFLITLIWVLFLVGLPFVQILASIWGHGLSDAQFVTVVTTTTASVFGFWLLVGRYLFKPAKAKIEPASEEETP